MDFAFEATDVAFRQEVRSWLQAYLTRPCATEGGRHRRLGELAVEIRGAAGAVGPDDWSPTTPYELDEAQRLFLFTRSDTIYGGSDEIQRNIIAERVLGLPREPR
ncbi:hypothetical protein GCM10018966_055070 [Streptomyces yanii]